MKLKVSSIVNKMAATQLKSGGYMYRWAVAGEIDGRAVDSIEIKTFKKEIADAVAPGVTFEAEEDRWKDKVSYVLREVIQEAAAPEPTAQQSGVSSFAKRDSLIVRQCAFKGVIDLIASGKIDLNMKEVTLWLNAFADAIEDTDGKTT